MYFRSEQWPGEMHIHAATLDDPNAYVPTEQVVTRSKVSWLNRLGSIPAHHDFEAEPEP
jgi:hypothetical protein